MLSLFRQWTLLAIEAQEVIALRTLRFASGDARAGREAQRMVSEKLEAAEHAMTMLATGGSAEAVLRSYRRRVRANARRLAKD